MNRLRSLGLLGGLLLWGLAYGQNLPVKTITDQGGAGTGTVTWSSDTVYRLQGLIFVNPGDTLTIAPGTVIKGQVGPEADSTGILVVSAGGHIHAEGSPTEPIIFTTELDDVTDPFDLPTDARAVPLWGGVHLLGRACNNNPVPVTLFEDLAYVFAPSAPSPGQDSLRIRYGAVDGPCDDSYDAGTLAYVSIRYAGAENVDFTEEFNGLSLIGVGTETELHHIEVAYTRDDAFEFRGSKLCAQYLMAGGIGDDCFDFDEGSQVTLQFISAVTGDPHGGSRILEIDGSLEDGDQQPYGRAELYNGTFISLDQSGTRPGDIRDNAQAVIRNSVFYGFERGLRVEVDADDSIDSYQQFLAGEVEVDCNLFWEVAQNDSNALLIPYASFNNDAPDSLSFATLRAYFDSSQNVIADPLFANLSNPDSLDLSPQPGSPLLTAGCPLPSGNACLSNAPYLGAFAPSSVGNLSLGWAQGWTFMSDFYYNAAQATTLAQPAMALAWRVFPNPTQGTLQVTWPTDQAAVRSLVLFDLQGRRLRQWQVDHVQATLSLTGLPSGLYLLQARGEAGLLGTQRVELR